MEAIYKEKKELKRLKESLKSICLIYSDYTNEKRRINFGLQMLERLDKVVNYNALSENEVVYKGAQWGGKWGNYYHAIFFKGGEFRYGEGFSNRQIVNY